MGLSLSRPGRSRIPPLRPSFPLPSEPTMQSLQFGDWPGPDHVSSSSEAPAEGPALLPTLAWFLASLLRATASNTLFRVGKSRQICRHMGNEPGAGTSSRIRPPRLPHVLLGQPEEFTIGDGPDRRRPAASKFHISPARQPCRKVGKQPARLTFPGTRPMSAMSPK